MSEILTKVRDVDPNNSDAVKEVLTSFFQNLSKHLEGDYKIWLRALEKIINRFPKYCGSHRNTIETYLTHSLDSYDYYNVIAAAKCAHALQQVRPAQDRNATPKVCWREHLLSLCNAAHKLVGLLFPTAVDMYKTSGNEQGMKLQLQSSASSPLCMALDKINTVSKTQNKNINKQLLLETRLRNIFVFLQATLVEVYPVAKPVQPQLILEVIARALSVSSGAKQAEDISKAVSVKVQALRTLDALVACLGPNLIPFSSLIFKFSLLTLAWSSEHSNEETQKVRIGAYSTLARWLRTLQTCRPADSPRGRRWEDELTAHVLADITPVRHLVQLTMSSQPTRHLSKKARRKLANSMLQESSIAAHAPGERNKIPVSVEASDEIAIAALDFAETFLNVCGVFLKPTTHKLFQERLVRECFAWASVSGCGRGARALRLVRALEAARGGAGPAPPPTHYCLQLYSVLANSRDLEVSKFCSQALLNIRLHLHCSPPSLTFAVEPETKKSTEKPKQMSSKNRTALESLLGAEKMPQNHAEKVIDLDGPSHKRPRLDNVEVADKISVSSESGSSVEISDESDDDVQEVMAVEIDDNEDEETATQVDEVDAGQTEESQESQDTQETNEESGTEDSRSKDASVVSKPTDECEDSRPKDAKTNKGNDPGQTGDSRSQDSSEVNKSKDESEDSTSKDTSDVSDIKPASGDSSSKEGDILQVESNKTKKSTSTSETGGETEESQEASATQDIHQASTQMPVNTSDEIAEELQSPRSMEVQISYDFPNTGETRVNIIEIPEDDLPSTNETDDVQINCGQVVKNSQEADNEKEVENKENEKPRVNGDKNDEDVAKGTESVTDKLTGKDVSVEDMLADFVDEINE